MKKTLILVVLITLIAAGTAFAGISGTSHDLRSFGVISSDYNYRVCVPCHIPHNADTSVTTAPLWNHNIDTTTSYTAYSSTWLDATMDTTFTGISALCMGCHDGTIAVDSFGYVGGAYAASGGTTTIGTVSAFLDTTLTNDHPVSFIYNTGVTTADGELNAASAVTLDLFGTAPNQKVECATCHDVHNNTFAPFLAMDNNGSALCLDCHNK